MASTTKVPLGAATLNRKWYLDVNTGTYGAPTWIGVFGVEEFQPSLEATLQPDSDFDSSGYTSSAVTAIGWSLTMKVARKVQASVATSYDIGQEALRAAAEGLGTANNVDVRWYEVTSGGPKVEAYRGYAAVSWAPDGGAMDALDSVSVTLTGKGARTAITHPDGAPSAIPLVTSINPTTGVQAGGYLVTIGGVRFTGTVGTTGVKFGVTNATSWQVLSDNTIVALAPAKSAGPFEIIVTNATGASTGGPSITIS